MDKDTLTKYAPLALVIFAIFFQYNLFVTPQQLETKHREILSEVQDKYTTKEQHNELSSQIKDIQNKIDRLIEMMNSRER